MPDRLTVRFYLSLATFIVACLLLIAVTGMAAAKLPVPDSPEMQRQTLQHAGLDRTYFLHLPPDVKPDEKLPVLFVLHGGGKANGRQTAQRTGFCQLADAERFIAVFPNGVDNQWNDGRGESFYKNPTNARVDDVGFLSALIDHVVAEHHADASRVYFCGASNGGMMSHRVGIELSDKVAAIAPMISNLPARVGTGQKPSTKMPVLIINGTADPLVPYDGGPVTVFGRELGEVLSTDETIRYWNENNENSDAVKQSSLPDRIRRDRSHVEVYRYGQRDSAAPVVLFRVVGGGHTLAGRSAPRAARRLMGETNLDFDSSRAIWNFVSQFSRED